MQTNIHSWQWLGADDAPTYPQFPPFQTNGPSGSWNKLALARYLEGEKSPWGYAIEARLINGQRIIFRAIPK